MNNLNDNSRLLKILKMAVTATSIILFFLLMILSVYQEKTPVALDEKALSSRYMSEHRLDFDSPVNGKQLVFESSNNLSDVPGKVSKCCFSKQFKSDINKALFKRSKKSGSRTRRPNKIIRLERD